VLVYLATHAECYADHTAIVFRPGIVYMPKAWSPGEKWDVHGVSGDVYSENGVEVCAGTNSWRSRVLGVEAMATGKPVIHTQTNETETLSPIEGTPDSAACPAGQTTTFDWQENFYIGAGITVRRADGSATGSDLGLDRSRDVRRAGLHDRDGRDGHDERADDHGLRRDTPSEWADGHRVWRRRRRALHGHRRGHGARNDRHAGLADEGEAEPGWPEHEPLLVTRDPRGRHPMMTVGWS
jgi:hypothetical protein